MTNIIDTPLFPAMQGRPVLHLGGLNADIAPMAIIVLSALLLLTSLLRRVLEAKLGKSLQKRTGLSAFALLRDRLEAADGSIAKVHPKASRRRNRNRSSTKLAPCVLPQHVLPPTSEKAAISKVDVEAHAGRETLATGGLGDHASDSSALGSTLLVRSAPVAAKFWKSHASGIEGGIGEKAHPDDRDQHASELAKVEAHGDAPLLIEETDMIASPGGFAGDASCGCEGEGMWGCERHQVYGKGLLLSHLAIHRKVALGAPGLQHPQQVRNQVVLPSTRVLPTALTSQTRSAKFGDAVLCGSHPRSSTTLRSPKTCH